MHGPRHCQQPLTGHALSRVTELDGPAVVIEIGEPAVLAQRRAEEVEKTLRLAQQPGTVSVRGHPCARGTDYRSRSLTQPSSGPRTGPPERRAERYASGYSAHGTPNAWLEEATRGGAVAKSANPIWGDDWEDVRRLWILDPEVAHCNHGSYGAVPGPVMAAQNEFRARMAVHPQRWFYRECPGLVTEARGEVARFVGAGPEEVALVSNVSAGVSAVVQSLTLEPGAEILSTNHAYGAVVHRARPVVRPHRRHPGGGRGPRRTAPTRRSPPSSPSTARTAPASSSSTRSPRPRPAASP